MLFLMWLIAWTVMIAVLWVYESFFADVPSWVRAEKSLYEETRDKLSRQGCWLIRAEESFDGVHIFFMAPRGMKKICILTPSRPMVHFRGLALTIATLALTMTSIQFLLTALLA